MEPAANAHQKSTYNATANRNEYSQTPSCMQLSLWSDGRASNAQGTNDWAGGQINWSSDDIRDHGYYSAFFANITMQCYEPPTGSGDEHRSCAYIDEKGLESSVRVTKAMTRCCRIWVILARTWELEILRLPQRHRRRVALNLFST